MTTTSFEPRSPRYAQRVRDSFGRQGIMHTLGARLGDIIPGAVDIALEWAPALTQQHDFLHAGVVATVLDSACGYAAYTLMSEDSAVLTIEFKINLLAPAKGERFRMEGRVVKPGRTITVCEGKAYALDGKTDKLIATMGCTLMAVSGREGIAG